MTIVKDVFEKYRKVEEIEEKSIRDRGDSCNIHIKVQR